MGLLVIVTTLVVLAALLLPVFARSKERAKLTDCASRLHQVALSVQMYRADHDGQGWLEYLDDTGGYTTAGRYRYPWNDWKAIKPYLKDGRLVWCPLPPRDERTVHNLYHLRRISKPRMVTNGSLTVRYPLEDESGRVVAYCGNHASSLRERPSPKLASHSDLFKGDHPFVREDGSTGVAKSRQIVPWYLWQDRTWHLQEQGKQVSAQVWRFPGEPWPPGSLPF